MMMMMAAREELWNYSTLVGGSAIASLSYEMALNLYVQSGLSWIKKHKKESVYLIWRKDIDQQYTLFWIEITTW